MVSQQEMKVWDIAVRGFHWTLVAGFMVAYFTEDDLMALHHWAGYLVVMLVGFRLVWGFVGPQTARFETFVFRPSTVFHYLADVFQLRAERYLGHNPAGGAMIVALLLAVTVSGVSGAALYGADGWAGPFAWLMKGTSDEGIDLLEDLHELSANATILLIVVHIGGVIWESVLHRENLVKAMWTGRKRAETLSVSDDD